ncbi:hypothetical protein GCM10007887_38570 [Methylobacterium haplocladii]|nr:hypothetical protein GCM10007887_38570 [Methylobacterium haplocladii]
MRGRATPSPPPAAQRNALLEAYRSHRLDDAEPLGPFDTFGATVNADTYRQMVMAGCKSAAEGTLEELRTGFVRPDLESEQRERLMVREIGRIRQR